MFYKKHVLNNEDRKKMLEVIGVASEKDLFAYAMDEFGMEEGWWPTELPDCKFLSDIESFMKKLAASNKTQYSQFLGYGCYRHYIHPAVDTIARMSGFLTSYTPYQPEMSQGVLGSLYDFQTYICKMTDMNVANASLYSGLTAIIEAILMSFRILCRSGPVFFVGKLHPHLKEILSLYRIEVAQEVSSEVSCIVALCVDAFGKVNSISKAYQLAQKLSAILVVSISDPLILFTEEVDSSKKLADIVVGEAGSLVSGACLGGVQLGFLATKSNHIRKMPGRIVGKTQDSSGNDCYSLILSTREQHIRKAKATSNICTNQTLYAVMLAAHLDLLGAKSMKALSKKNSQYANIMASFLGQIDKVTIDDDCVFNEFTIIVRDVDSFIKHMREKGILPGVKIDDDSLLVCVTEMNSREEILNYIKCANDFFNSGLIDLDLLIEQAFAFEDNGNDSNLKFETDEIIKQMSEREVIQKYSLRDRSNYGVDVGMYPLGSCTMKFNPKINEAMFRLDGFSSVHPASPEDVYQGSLKLMWLLQKVLCAATQMKGCCLWPYAGAQGELVGLAIIKRKLEFDGKIGKTKVLIPSSAHGTNFASAQMAGFSPIEVPVGDDGIVNFEDISQYIDESVATVMITNPNTCGLFERDIKKISKALRAVGGYLYCDGANLNAILGILSPLEMGIDVMQINLHKTFSTPHGGGGPGCGPVLVSDALLSFLPNPIVCIDIDSGNLYLSNNSCSVGRCGLFFSQFPVMIRALTYILCMGESGLIQNAKDAVMSANYLMKKLSEAYFRPYKSICMHEFVISDKFQRDRNVPLDLLVGIIMSNKIHPMTVHFPPIVKGAMLIEPTETESIESLDIFADLMLKISVLNESEAKSLNRIATNPRVDQVLASERPNCFC